MMEFIHTQKNLNSSPKKMREVSVLMKKLSPERALAVLPHVRKKAAGLIFKTLKAAVANAKQKGVLLEDLTIKEIQVGDGGKKFRKRWRAGARGRAKPYTRRLSHLRIVLASQKKEAKEAKADKKKGDK